jgi:Domain of unknown function (DUF4293)
MIQRIQTVFYLVALLLMAIPLLGMEIFTFSNENVIHHVTLFGNTRELLAADEVTFKLAQLPLFWGNVVVLILLIFTIILYKNLRLQLRLGRFVLSLYLIVIAGLFVVLYFVYTWLIVTGISLHIGAAMYLMIAGIPFVWLGNRGVNKDRKLLDSMDRLR